MKVWVYYLKQNIEYVNLVFSYSSSFFAVFVNCTKKCETQFDI